MKRRISIDLTSNIYKDTFYVSKNITICFRILGIFILLFLLNGVSENITLNKRIEDFKSKGVFVREEKNGYGTTRFYEVSRETYATEDETLSGNRTTLSKIGGNYYIGSRGDIMVTKNSPFPDRPILDSFISFYFGGHGGLICDTKNYLESVGNQDEDNCVRYYENDWFYFRKSTIGLRLKNATATDYDEIVKQAEKKLGKPYNYSFVLNTNNSYYCTDLMSTSIYEYKKELYPNDYFVTTVNDLVNSKKTYIFYYQCFDKNDVKHVYYLE